jgi:hypothetical protein
MAFSFRKFLLGLNLVPKSATTADSKGDLEVIDGSGKLQFHNGTTVSPIVTEAHSATLTNKTIDADDNTISDLSNTNIKSGAQIDATKIANGTVNDAEFQFLNGVTSAIQTQLNNSQPVDATLTALAAYNTNGLVVQTASDTFAGRTITGTSNQVNVSNGDGVSGNPTLSLPQNIDSGATPSFTQVAVAGDPSTSLQVATKQYVDSLVNGIRWKQSVLVATTANITLSGEQTIDGVLTSASRVLVKNQSSGAENGIYVSAAGAWSRSSDANSALELTSALVMIEQGTVGADKGYIQTADSITLETTPLVWTQSFGTGLYVADGQGIELSGSTFSLELDGSSLSKSASGVKVNVSGSPVGTTDSQTLTNKTIDADSNTITNIDNADIKTGAAIDRSKLASGTAHQVIINDSGGVLSGVSPSTTGNVLTSNGTSWVSSPIASGGGATVTQQTSAPTSQTLNDLITVSHPTVVNNKVTFSAMEASIGNSNTTNNFSSSSNYTREDNTKITIASNTATLTGAGTAGLGLLLKFNGTNGSTTFTDSSASAHTMSANGSAALSTGTVKFGSASLNTPNSTAYAYTTSGMSDFAFGTGDFTIQFWAYNSNFSQSLDIMANKRSTNTDSGEWFIGYRGAAGLFFSNSIDFSYDSLVTPSNNTWHHIAVTRSGTTLRIFLDGTIIKTATDSTNFNSTGGRLCVGQGFHNPGTGTPGMFFDDVGTVKGTALYTANYTPPTTELAGLAYDTTQEWYVATASGSQVDTTTMSRVASLSISSSTPGSTTLKGLVSFDGRSTWSKWNGSAWAFEVNNAGISSYDFSTNGNTIVEIQTGFTNLSMDGISTLDFVYGLKTTNAAATPSVGTHTITYDGLYEAKPITDFAGSAGYGVKRLTPTTTQFKKLSSGTARTILNVIQ